MLHAACNKDYFQLKIAIPWIEFNEKFDRSILAPFFDMLNHSERENCSYAYDLGYYSWLACLWQKL